MCQCYLHTIALFEGYFGVGWVREPVISFATFDQYRSSSSVLINRSHGIVSRKDWWNTSETRLIPNRSYISNLSKPTHQHTMEASPPTSTSDSPVSTSSPTSSPEEAASSPPVPRKKWTRAECHASRDLYFECHAASGGDEEACSDLKDRMFEQCPLSWAKFFVGKAKTQRHVERLDSLSQKVNRDLGSPLADIPSKPPGRWVESLEILHDNLVGRSLVYRVFDVWSQI